jgi:hypothetical protein
MSTIKNARRNTMLGDSALKKMGWTFQCFLLERKMERNKERKKKVMFRYSQVDATWVVWQETLFKLMKTIYSFQKTKNKHHFSKMNMVWTGFITFLDLCWLCFVTKSYGMVSIMKIITHQLFSTYWIILELGIFRTRLTNSQIGSGFKAWPLN